MTTDNIQSALHEIFQINSSVALKLSKDDALKERQLNETKWFDYRFIPPLTATELFADAYRKVYKRKWALNFDSEEAERKSGMRSHVWTSNSREFISFWRARQLADTLGVPYEYFLGPAMEILTRIGWTRLPRPNQLYGDNVRELIVAAIEADWAEWRRTVHFVFSELPQYKIEAFRGLPAQIAHQNWVIDQIKLWHGSPNVIGRACFVDRVLPEERAVAEFGAERINRARAVVADMSGTSELIPCSPQQLLPSCYGVLHAFDLRSKSCSECGSQKACGASARRVEEFTIKTKGSSDPVSARRREQQRDRTRKFRAGRAVSRKASISCVSGATSVI